MSKSEHLANQQKTSRMSKRGTLTQSNQKLLPSKSPKPNNLSKISDDKQKSALEMPNYKSIFLVTAEFLLKYNAFTVNTRFLIFLDFDKNVCIFILIKLSKKVGRKMCCQRIGISIWWSKLLLSYIVG